MRNVLTRSQAGEILIKHKGKDIPTSVGSAQYESLNFDRQVQAGKIPMGFHHRPDLIADLFFGGSKNWWQVCELNNVFDVFEDLDKGEVILLPVT